MSTQTDLSPPVHGDTSSPSERRYPHVVRYLTGQEPGEIAVMPTPAALGQFSTVCRIADPVARRMRRSRDETRQELWLLALTPDCAMRLEVRLAEDQVRGALYAGRTLYLNLLARMRAIRNREQPPPVVCSVRSWFSDLTPEADAPAVAVGPGDYGPSSPVPWTWVVAESRLPQIERTADFLALGFTAGDIAAVLRYAATGGTALTVGERRAQDRALTRFYRLNGADRPARVRGKTTYDVPIAGLEWLTRYKSVEQVELFELAFADCLPWEHIARHFQRPKDRVRQEAEQLLASVRLCRDWRDQPERLDTTMELAS